MLDMGQKSTLVRIVTDQGWIVARAIATDLLKAMDGAALECEDDTKVAGLVREARAARKFWDAFILNIDRAKDPAEKDSDTFNEVSY